MTSGYICPVCGYPDLSEAPQLPGGGGSSEICSSCGFEFGYTDDYEEYTYESYRAEWVERGMPWDAGELDAPPPNWNPAEQLQRLLDGDINGDGRAN